MVRKSLFEVFCAVIGVALLAVTSQASVITSTISFENDGDYPGVTNFGTVKITDLGGNEVQVEIYIDNSILGVGPAADIQHFGFQIANFSDTATLTLSPASISGEAITLFKGPSGSTKVSGMGNTQFDYMVDFGNGSPILNPVTFTLAGSDLDHSFTFGTANFLSSDWIPTNTRIATNFGIHVQHTGANSLGSEALGGFYGPPQTPPGVGGDVPEPNALVVFGLLAMSCCSIRARRKM